MIKEKLRIIFMGTPDFAVATLKKLIEEKYNIVGVITAPGRKAGRGQKISESAVKKYAKENGLHLLQPTNLKSEAFIDELKSLNANLQIVVAFRMLPKVVWDMPEYGTFNLHASLLPNYRGAAPIHWAIINGEKTTGVTTFFIDEKIDTGAIILNKKVNIKDDETVGELHDSLMTIGSELVIETVQLIESGNVKTETQPKLENLKTAYKLNKDNCKIDWNLQINEIYNKIRGLNPYPAAWCHLNNGVEQITPVKIFDIKKEISEHKYQYGHIINQKDDIKIAVNGGFIVIELIQLPGKRKMTVKDLKNGFTFEKEASMC